MLNLVEKKLFQIIKINIKRLLAIYINYNKSQNNDLRDKEVRSYSIIIIFCN